MIVHTYGKTFSDIGHDNLTKLLFLSQTFNDIHYLSSFFIMIFPVFLIDI